MKDAENIKAYYYFDEAGNPDLLGRHGVNLVERGVASKVFMVGYLETKNPKVLLGSLKELHKEICEDELLQGIPSMEKTKVAFHAAKYEQDEYRFYNYLKDKIKVVHDILDLKFYTPKHPLEKQKMNPV